MLRISAAFFVLFLGAVAVISFLPSPPKVVSAASAIPAPTIDAPVSVARQDVRVVYPANGVANPPSGGTTSTGPSVPAPRVETVSPPSAPSVAAAAPEPGSPAIAPAPASVNPTEASAQAGTRTVDLNTASIEELNNIPGVGRIGRTIASHRPYRSVEELLQKRVIRKSVYDRIKDQVAAQ